MSPLRGTALVPPAASFQLTGSLQSLGEPELAPCQLSVRACSVGAASRNAAANARNPKPAGRRAQRADTAIGCVRMVAP